MDDFGSVEANVRIWKFWQESQETFINPLEKSLKLDLLEHFLPGVYEMTKHWTLVLIVLVLATGCDQQAANQTLDEAKAAAAEAKISEAKTIPATKILTREEAMKASTETRLESTPKPNARKILAQAVATAKADDKALLVHFSADW